MNSTGVYHSRGELTTAVHLMLDAMGVNQLNVSSVEQIP